MHDTDFQTITAGDGISVSTSAEGYPSADWAARYQFRPQTGTGTGFAIVGTAAADGVAWMFAAAPADTVDYPPGDYSWFLVVSSGSTGRAVPRSGVATVKPDPLTTTGALDVRSQAQVALTEAKAALAAWTPTRKSYSIAGRSMTFNDVAEIQRVVDYWQAEVMREKRRANPQATRIYVGFDNAR